MNLDDLNNLKRKADCITSESDKQHSASILLSNCRKSDATLIGTISKAADKWSYGHYELAKIALFEVLNEQKHDLIRLAELRLSAKSRENKIIGAQKSCIVTASILPIDGELK